MGLQIAIHIHIRNQIKHIALKNHLMNWWTMKHNNEAQKIMIQYQTHFHHVFPYLNWPSNGIEADISHGEIGEEVKVRSDQMSEAQAVSKAFIGALRIDIGGSTKKYILKFSLNASTKLVNLPGICNI
ncbi:hypothetical protein H5410_028345 [Solanum commersonii]|uniref:Uncharacterized protein n=1 Tax=Solanum commersonii TaxID=4109 RepID=A0A9J5Z3S0_SOLCO|nr:hypothetical protein H5410_028345 [Solanum commersonii]